MAQPHADAEFGTGTRNQSAEKLQRETDRLSRAEHVAEMGFLEWNLETNDIHLSVGVKNLFGIADEEPQTAQELMARAVHPDDLDFVQRNLEAVLRGVQPYDIDHRIVRPDGDVRWVRAQAEVSPKSNGKPTLLLGTVVDITRLKNTEQLLRESEENLADFFESATIGLHWVGPDGIILRANRAELEMLGYAEEEYIGRHIADFHVDQTVINENFQRLLNHETICDCKAQLRCNDGTTMTVLIDSSALWRDDRMIHTRCFTRDITARKQVEQALRLAHDELERRVQERTSKLSETNVRLLYEVGERVKAERALRESEEQYRNLLENHVDGVVVVREGRIRYVNERMSELFGYSREELLKRSPLDFVVPSDWPRVGERIRNLMKGGEEFASEYRTPHKDGRILTIEILSRLIRYHRQPALLCVMRDVTRRKDLEHESHRHRDELAHANRMNIMGEMATGLAHELNQPLTAIATYASICETKVLGETGRAGNREFASCLKKIKEQSLRAGEIIHRLRRFVKKERPQPVEFDINDAVRHTAAFMTSEYDSNGVTNRLDLASDLPTCFGDLVQVEQIILNLIRNATEAMRDGQSTRRELSIRTLRCESTEVAVDVCDSGPGIESVDLERIFDAFVTSKPDGMGLGLAISRSIAEAHGGTLTASINDGEGMAFRLTLPTRPRR